MTPGDTFSANSGTCTQPTRTPRGGQGKYAQAGMPYVCALYVCLICVSYMYALYVCLICTTRAPRGGQGKYAQARMPYMCMPYTYALYVCLICTRIEQQTYTSS